MFVLCERYRIRHTNCKDKGTGSYQQRQPVGIASVHRWRDFRIPYIKIYSCYWKKAGFADCGNLLSLQRNLLRHRILCYNIEVIFDVDPSPYSTTGAEDASYLHPRLMTLMYSAAIGALRGMLALRVENTFLKDYPLPLINISELVSERIYGRKADLHTIPLVDFVYN